MASATRESVQAHFDKLAPELARWKRKNWLYHANLEREIRRLVSPGQRVLEIGCATGDLLAAVEPSRGVGIDLSPKMIELAGERYPHLEFRVADAETLELEGEEFDVILMVHLVGHLGDIQGALGQLRKVCGPDTRVIVVTYNYLYEAPFRIAERLRLKMPHRYQSWAPVHLLRQLLSLADFEVVHEIRSLLVPKHIPFVSAFLNWLARAFRPLRHLCITQILVARPIEISEAEDLSCTVLVPTRNELGNIRDCVERIPQMGRHTEILFVDGNSTDGTWEEIQRLIAEYEGKKDIKAIVQVPAEEAEGDPSIAAAQRTGKMLPQGKGHAVRIGFDAAEGDVLMILDADLAVPPEDLPHFFAPIARGKADLTNGSRLVYPMEADAMRVPNLIANKFFSFLFSWLLGGYVGDTLCGTKVLRKEQYDRIAANRAYFGEFDPFGDFDLLFGAARLGLRIVDIPVHYRARTSGKPKIINLRHGPMLLRMSWVGFWRLKFPQWMRALKLAWSGPPKPLGSRG